MKNKYIGPVPAYAVLPALITAAAGVSLYYVSRIIADGFVHYDVSLPIDDMIPFVPQFVYIYVLAYAQWVITLLLLATEKKEFFYRYLSAYFLANFGAFLFFVFAPTIMSRGDLSALNDADPLTRMLMGGIFGLDSPTNLFPSVHCIDSWFCFRVVAKSKRLPRWFAACSLVFTLLVFASTVLCKQHMVADIFGGIIMAEIAILLAEKFDTGRVYSVVERGLRIPGSRAA